MSTSLVRSAKKKGKTIDKNLSKKEEVKIVRRKTTKRGRKNVMETVPYMPGTVFYDILVKFSASFVHGCRLVNKEWRDVISRSDFISQNFESSDRQLLLQCPKSGKRTNFDVKIMNFDEKNGVCKLASFDLPETGLVRPSCYGLLLASVPNQPGFLRVLNPVTKKILTVPRFPSCCPHKACAAALGFNPLTKEFKVVHMYTTGAGFEILTLGRQENALNTVFVPRKVEIPDPLFTWRDPLLSENGRVLHWNVKSNRFILSMDIAEEKVLTTYLPDVPMTMIKWKYVLLEMDGCVAAVYYDSFSMISIWVLKDFRASLWDQRDYIRKGAIKLACGEINYLPPLKELVPVGFNENGRYLVFKHEETYFGHGLYLYIYDMDSREMKKRYKVNNKMTNMESLFTYRSSLFHWNTFRE